ncbi:MAG: leucine-rich repeat domain-containing protein [Selenomonadaceae bacterium]|nr:leucine-rich repeat domain-containing protein [Selenomonadaceae bacterium]
MTGGKCGKNLTWTLDYRDILTISGKGKMDDYDFGYKSPSPWINQRDLIKKVVIENGITSIGERAFNFCTRLTSITIPDSVTSIGERAFSACTRLTSIKVPDSVISIGEEIFNDCGSLKEIRYPAGRDFGKVLSQGNNAKLIPYNTAPPSAQVKSSTTKPANERKFIPVVNQTPKPVVEKLRWKVEGKTLTVGGVREIKDFSKEEPPWVDSIDNIQKIVIEEGVEKISANAFIDCRRLELLTIPASVKTIGDTAFTACYCGNRLENGGRNVFWCLEDGVLIFKKNPAAKSAFDFSIDVVSWLAVEKNITGFKLEPGVVPKEKFFDRLAKRGNALHVSFS